jgi:hypothetical protein
MNPTNKSLLHVCLAFGHGRVFERQTRRPYLFASISHRPGYPSQASFHLTRDAADRAGGYVVPVVNRPHVRAPRR